MDVNEYFSHIAEFTSMAKAHLITDDKQAFLRWFEKLYRMDRRALLLFMRAHRDEFDSSALEIAQRYYSIDI